MGHCAHVLPRANRYNAPLSLCCGFAHLQNPRIAPHPRIRRHVDGSVSLFVRVSDELLRPRRSAAAEMRALVSRLKPSLAAAPRAAALRYLAARFFHQANQQQEKGRSAYILGEDLPEIWNPLGSLVSSPLCARAEGDDKLGPSIIDGKSIAEDIRLGIAEEVRFMKNAIKKVPGLAVILVGQRRDSQTYVRRKTEACQEVGITSLITELPDDCADEDVVNAVARYNEDPSVHGILVQLPLPKHMDEERILGAINLEKDVDGFHPLNMGNLALRGREPLFIPCAAKACIELLLRTGVKLLGKHVAVIGRSKVVGLPTCLLLQRHHATVSNVHAFTKNPEEITRDADIVISAAGVANLVRRSWLKQGSVVIDVGINPVEDPSSEQGYHITGDVCYEEARQVASAITPVPGGVGPVTIAMLLSNALESAKRIYGLS